MSYLNPGPGRGRHRQAPAEHQGAEAFWNDLDPEQVAQAPPSRCRYCGRPIYWETMTSGKKRPVDALDFDSHLCLNRPRRKGKNKTPPRGPN